MPTEGAPSVRASDVALPAPGARTIRMSQVSVTCQPYLREVERRMLRADGEVDWASYHQIRPYQAPFAAQKSRTS